MKKFFSLFILAFIVLQSAAQETFPVNGVPDKNHNHYAFTNAKLIIDYQTTIENGTLLIKDGLIVAAGEKITIPPNSVILDLKGKCIYPSFIDCYTSIGMPEIKKNASPKNGTQMERASKGAFNWNQAIKSETDAAKVYTTDVKMNEELRKCGFGAAMTFIRDGIARGTSAMVLLGDGRENENIILGNAAAMYSFDKGTSTQDYPSSLMGAIALLRQTYLDANWYKNNTGKREHNISLEAWNNNQSVPQIFEVSNKLSALRADKIGDEFNVQYIIKGAGDEYQRLEEIKQTWAKWIIPINFPAAYDITDIYDATLIAYEDLKHWEMAPANPGFLEQKYIDFAITTADLKDRNLFFKNIRKAIRYGLSEKQAIKSLTTIPAALLNVTDKLGALKPGMMANFVITSTNIFSEKNMIYQNWVGGIPYIINELNAIDIRGNYELTTSNGLSYQLRITGTPEKPQLNVIPKDTTQKITGTVTINGDMISLQFTPKNAKTTISLSGTVLGTPPTMSGKGQDDNGEWFSWKASSSGTFTKDSPVQKDSAIKNLPKIEDVLFPFCAYGQAKEEKTIGEKFRTRWDAVLFKNVTVWTNEPEGILKNKDVYITEGRIVRIDDNIQPTKLAFAKVIDGTGKHLTSGIIDEHSHIAISGGGNEGTQASSAEVRIGDILNCDDINIYRQLAGGVIAAQILHGSANPIGGQSALIKLRWGKAPEEMKIKNADGFIKFALGENVKQSNWGDYFTVRFPQTRMGVEQVYYDYFTRAKEYMAQKAAAEKTKNTSFRKNLELEAITEILDKKRFITCHSYVQSEINMLLHVADSMGFKVNTFTHILEGYKVADKMKAHNAGGSSFSDWWAYKMEVRDAIPYNGALMNQMGITVAFNSDDAEMARRLNQEAAKAVKYGNVSEEEAWKFVTLNPAKLLHLDAQMGSIKPGKSADVVLWSDHPLSIYAKAEKTLVDGIIYYDIERDSALREEIKKDRARIIQKMIAEKTNGGETQKPQSKTQKLYHCESMEENYMNE